MAVEIKSGAGSDLATVDPQSKAIRVTHYSSDGLEVSQELPVKLTTNTASAINEDILISTIVEPYKFVSLQVKGTWSGAVTVQGSNDGIQFFDVVFQDVSDTTSPYSTSLTSNVLIKIPVLFRRLRVRVSTYNSGNVEAEAYGYHEANSFNSVSQVGSVTLSPETDKVIGTVNVADQTTSLTSIISASDTQVSAPAGDGVMVTGTASVDSYVGVPTFANDSSWVVEIDGDLGTGTTFHFEGSVSSTNGIDGNWTTINGRQTGVVNTSLDSKTTTAGFFRGTLAGIKFFRVRATGGTGINADVTIHVGYGSGAVFLNASIPEGSNNIGSVALATDSTVSLESGTNVIGDVGLTAGNKIGLDSGSELIGTVKVIPSITDSPDYLKFISATGVNSTVVKASAANLGILHIVNGAATLRYFKLYNKATAPIVGTDIPLITITLSPNSASNFTLPALVGIDFSIGLSFAVLLGVQDSSTTPFTVSGEVTAMLAYT